MTAMHTTTLIKQHSLHSIHSTFTSPDDERSMHEFSAAV